MKRIYYKSRALEEFLAPDLELLAKKAAKKNRKLGITGYLSYSDGKFVECLEGDEQAIDALLKEIRNDGRHCIVHELSWEGIEQRIFDSWVLRKTNQLQGDADGGEPALKRVFYVSQALVSFSEDELLELAEQAARKNEDLGVTGYLSYSSGRFMQYLEGDQPLIDALFDQIRRDSRHEILDEVEWPNVGHRMFGSWSMRHPTVEDLLAHNHQQFVEESGKFPDLLTLGDDRVDKSVFYVSRALVDFTDEALADLVDRAVDKNQRLGVTGYLSFQRGRFLQYFEGGEHEVDGLLREIRADPRHEFLQEVIWAGPAPRLFKAWAMRRITYEEILQFDHESFIERSILCADEFDMLEQRRKEFIRRGIARIVEMKDQLGQG